MPDNSLSDEDLNAAARTILGEAGNQGDAGMAAVAHVILNRRNSGDWGDSISSVVHAPGQFQSWQSSTNNPASYANGNPALQHAKDIVRAAASNTIPDITGGADQFYNSSQAKLPGWAKSNPPTAVIGGHSFYNSKTPDVANDWYGYDPQTPSAPPSAPAAQGDLASEWYSQPNQPANFSQRFTGEQPVDTTPTTTNIGRGIRTGLVQSTGHILSDVGNAAMLDPGMAQADYNSNVTPEQASASIQRNVTGFIPKPTGLSGEISTDIGASLPYILSAPTGGAGIPSMLARVGMQSTLMGAGTTAGREIAPDNPVLGPLIGAAAGGLTASGIEAGATALGRGVGNVWNYFTNPSASAVKTVQQFAGPNAAVDAREIVPGSTPTLAEATGNPGIATLQRQVRDTNPQPFVQAEKSNAEARKSYWESTIGNQEDINNATAQRETNTQESLGQIFKPGQVADATPVRQTIDDILSGPSGGRTSVQTALNKVRDVLVDDKDNPSSDPMYLWKSVRGEIGDLLDKQGDTKAGVQAERQLLQVRDSLDQTISKASPGFSDFLKSYTNDSQPIEAMKYLQGTNILNPSSGEISLPKVQATLDRIDKARISGGIGAAKSVTDDQYQALTNIRDDLRRSQNTELGKTRGSATSQNLATRGQIPGLPQVAGHFLANTVPTAIGLGTGAVAGHLFPGMGEIAGSAFGAGAGALISKGLASRSAALSQELSNRLVNPMPFQTAMASRGVLGRYAPSALGLLPASQNGLGQP